MYCEDGTGMLPKPQSQEGEEADLMFILDTPIEFLVVF